MRPRPGPSAPQNPAWKPASSDAASMDRASSKEALSRKDEDATRLPELGAEGVSTLEGPGDALARPPGRAGESEQLFSLLLRGGTCSVESCVALTRVDP